MIQNDLRSSIFLMGFLYFGERMLFSIPSTVIKFVNILLECSLQRPRLVVSGWLIPCKSLGDVFAHFCPNCRLFSPISVHFLPIIWLLPDVKNPSTVSQGFLSWLLRWTALHSYAGRPTIAGSDPAIGSGSSCHGIFPSSLWQCRYTAP